jgi:hypothetical protein
MLFLVFHQTARDFLAKKFTPVCIFPRIRPVNTAAALPLGLGNTVTEADNALRKGRTVPPVQQPNIITVMVIMIMHLNSNFLF